MVLLGFIDDTVRRFRLFSLSITNKNTLIHQTSSWSDHRREQRERECVCVCLHPNNITEIYSFQSTI